MNTKELRLTQAQAENIINTFNLSHSVMRPVVFAAMALVLEFESDKATEEAARIAEACKGGVVLNADGTVQA